MSLVSNAPSQPQSTPSTSKRPPSPEPHRRREESRAPDYGPPVKRARGGSRERDRDRWDGPSRRRYNSPGWDRDRDRESSARRSMREEREDEKPATLPPVLSWFVGMLPAPGAFDGMWLYTVVTASVLYAHVVSVGPVFRTDDLMQVFRNAVIPSSSVAARGRSPPPPPRGGQCTCC